VLRTEELLAAHRFEGAEPYFTLAVDFGYSYSIDETLEKWGKQDILGDYVRMIRTIRPDVIVGFVFDGAGGGQHHQTSSRLTAEAFRAAADPAQFPDQIQKEGLHPWQAKKFYYTAGFGGPGPGGGQQVLSGEGASKLLVFNGGDAYDPVLVRTFSEIAGEARSMHKCQGMSQLLPLPAPTEGGFGFGPIRGNYRLRDTVFSDGVNRGENDLFDGIDTRLTSLAAYAGANPPADLVSRLERIMAAVAEARAALQKAGSTAAVPSLLRGMTTVREIRSQLPSMSIPAEAKYEIDQRLKLKDAQFGEALLLAADVRLDAVARDGLVVAGQPITLDLVAANRSGVVPVMMSKRSVGGFETEGTLCKDDALMRGPESQTACTIKARIPASARLTAAHFKYAAEAARFVVDSDVAPGLPFRPTPFTATFVLNVAGVDVSTTVPVQFRSEGDILSGEKREEVHVVPKFAVTLSPDIAVVPLGATPANARGTERDLRVTVINHSPGATKAEVQLDLPQAWKATPATAPVSFSREDESITVRFKVMVPPSPMLKPGDVMVKAHVSEGSTTYAQGYQVIEYPHTTRRHVLRAPEAIVKILDVKVKPNLTVGYVMGVGDEIPPALEQIGAKVELLGEDDLAWGDLNRFDVVMTGVRAYERRADLRANNQRLLDYAKAGGTVIVNYNKFEFNEAQYGPYPGKVGRERITDENSIVRVLQPENPVFTTPNKIGDADWKGWRQERGLYFFDMAGRDPQIVDLLEMADPFPYNEGRKRGALVEAKVGQGRWIYIGLGLWRQLPAGTDGAYRLMANLLSLGSRPGGSPPR
jgi:hypothetical protein